MPSRPPIPAGTHKNQSTDDRNMQKLVPLVLVALAGWAGLAGVVPAGPPEPPELVLTVNGAQDQTVHGARGSYCWEAGGAGRCVDTVGPEDLIGFHDLTATSIVNGSRITIQTIGHPEPAGYLYQFRANGTSLAGGSIRPAGTISPPRVGALVLVVSARWDAGDVSYAFPLDVARCACAPSF